MISARFFNRLGLATLFALFSLSLFADTLVSRVDRNSISLNETLNLVVEYDEQVDSRSVDLSALQQDFEILNSSQGSQVRIINGRQDVSTNWNLTLLPRRSGQLLIPSFQVAGNFSEAITIEVTEPSATGARSQPINVEVELNSQSVFTMQQLLVTVRSVSYTHLTLPTKA